MLLENEVYTIGAATVDNPPSRIVVKSKQGPLTHNDSPIEDNANGYQEYIREHNIFELQRQINPVNKKDIYTSKGRSWLINKIETYAIREHAASVVLGLVSDNTLESPNYLNFLKKHYEYELRRLPSKTFGVKPIHNIKDQEFNNNVWAIRKSTKFLRRVIPDHRYNPDHWKFMGEQEDYEIPSIISAKAKNQQIPPA